MAGQRVKMGSARVLAGVVASGLSVLALAQMVGPAGASPTPPPAALTGTQHHVCDRPLPGTAACHAIVLTPDTSSTRVSPAKHVFSSTTTSTSTSTTTSSTSTTTSTTAAPTTTSTTSTTLGTSSATCAFTPTSSGPSGYGPCDLEGAYALFGAAATVPGTAPTVAIVDAYDDPNAASDLAVYRSHYGLPACATSTGCFRKVNQTGGTTYPSNNTSWAQEISLDVDMVSATCPYCRILLVEANSNSYSDLFTAENEAVSLGAIAISNSWGGSEFSSEANYDGYFNHPGVAITASAGDTGYGVEYPAASPYVTAVGGTHLTRSSATRGWSETVWSGTGSGCSAYEPQPSWQASLGLTGCGGRMVGDVAAVADPNTGVAVYDTDGTSGWLIFGGTSVASPLIASVYALAGNTSNVSAGSYPYAHPTSLNDVTSGSNSSTGCSVTYLCTGTVGYDGPTGLGTPSGTSGF